MYRACYNANDNATNIVSAERPPRDKINFHVLPPPAMLGQLRCCWCKCKVVIDEMRGADGTGPHPWDRLIQSNQAGASMQKLEDIDLQTLHYVAILS